VISHVVLDGVECLLYDERAVNRTLANQMAAQIGSGAGDYDDLLGFNAWLQDDWGLGVGKKDPEAGGFLYATADTRHKQQLSLPGMVRHVTETDTFPGAQADTTNYHQIAGPIAALPTLTTVTIGVGETYTKLAQVFTVKGATYDAGPLEVLLPGTGEDCEAVKVELWSTTLGVPNVPVSVVTVNLTGRQGWFWYAADLAAAGDAVVDVVWAIVVYPTSGTITVPTTDRLGSEQFGYTGSAWTASVPSFMARFHTDLEIIVGGGQVFNHICHFDDLDYLAYGENLFHYDGTTFTTVAGYGTDITDLFALDSRLYVGLGDSTNYQFVNTSAASTAAAVPGRLFLLHNGLLYRAVGPDVYYTNDEVSWTAVEVGLSSRETVRGMAGLAGEIIVSTNRALYRIVEGDAVQLLTLWGAPSDTNGEHMFNFQGNIYISLGESVLRFDGENFLPFGPDLGEGLPTHFSGNIVGFAANNNWLACAVAGTTGSMWIHNGQGWHFGVELPQGLVANCIAYTTESNGFSRFLIGSTDNTAHEVLISDTKKAMRRASEVEGTDYQYHHFSGWLETDWFYGGLREVLKDWESIYIDGENIDEQNYVEVYWKVDETDDWSLLGAVTEATQELRWSDYETRPESRRLRVGVALYNGFSPSTPVVTAIRVKYHPMITDRWRWQFPVAVHNNAESPDGDVSPYNTAVMLAHLDALIKQVPPFIFIDEDSVQYEVKIVSGNRRSVKVEYDAPSETLERQWVYDLVLEQVTADAYTP
jgi:hypothetical protein